MSHIDNKLPITLVVITCNEERNIRRCLEAANFCSELLVVDSGSTDRTCTIADSLGARVLHRDWTGYGDQKNFGSDHAQQPWIFCIDADEVVTPELRESILTHFQTEPAVDGFEINRHGIYAGRLINHSGWYPEWRTFLYRKDCARWSGYVHEAIQFSGCGPSRLRGDLLHYTYSGIGEHLRKNIHYAQMAAEEMHKRGRKASFSDLMIRGPWAAFRRYFLQRGFLDGFHGFLIAVVGGLYTFLKYAFLRELQHRRSADDVERN